jgi:hypothetical protein
MPKPASGVPLAWIPLSPNYNLAIGPESSREGIDADRGVAAAAKALVQCAIRIKAGQQIITITDKCDVFAIGLLYQHLTGGFIIYIPLG